MKLKIIAGCLMALLSLMTLSLVAVSAQEVGEEALDRADEEAMAARSVFWSRIRLFFTMDREKKAETALSIANRHSLDAEEALERGDVERAEASIGKAENMANRAKESIEEIDVSEEIEEAGRNLEALNRSRERFEEHRKLVENVHSRILEDLSERMTEEQLARVEAAFSSHEEGIERARNAMEQRERNVEARIRIGRENNGKVPGEIEDVPADVPNGEDTVPVQGTGRA